MKHVKHIVFDEADVLFTEDQGFASELKLVREPETITS